MTHLPDLQYVIDLARAAGGIVLDHYGQVERLTKTHAAAHNEAVTDADRASQRFIVSGLKSRFPSDGIVGEESDTGTSITAEFADPMGRVWVIDPIDGTNNFIAGLGNFAVCIGLIEAGIPVMGVVYDVCRDEVYASARGHGAWRNNKPISVAENPLDEASMLMLTANLLDKQGHLPGWGGVFLGQTAWKVRILGSAALEAVQVAAGIAHAAITVHGKLWDCAAPAAIVLEAGGILTNFAGRPIFPFDLRGYKGAKVPFIAGTPLAQPVIREIVQKNP